MVACESGSLGEVLLRPAARVALLPQSPGECSRFLHARRVARGTSLLLPSILGISCPALFWLQSKKRKNGIARSATHIEIPPAGLSVDLLADSSLALASDDLTVEAQLAVFGPDGVCPPIRLAEAITRMLDTLEPTLTFEERARLQSCETALADGLERVRAVLAARP